jgi:hypothetical protein
MLYHINIIINIKAQIKLYRFISKFVNLESTDSEDVIKNRLHL